MLVLGDPQTGQFALAALGVYLSGNVLSLWVARRLRCNLCHGEVLRDRGARKHRDAQKLPFLSHPLTVAIYALFTGGFRCMYCGTAFRLKK